MNRHPILRERELQSQIEKLLRAKPETGEQWADICALEAEMINLQMAA